MHYKLSLLALLVLFQNIIGKQIDPVYINDFSRLNKTHIEQLATPTNYAEVADILKKAGQENKKISIAGIRHSQGGHAFYPDAIVINLKNLNRILRLDLEHKLITVQTGASWADVQNFLNPHHLAVKIMQFANFFTIGGALSVNANGIDPHFGPLIESVRSIKIMKADGSIVTANRTENSELFKLAIGGYGLFGIILEATLEIVDNTIYKRKATTMSLQDYVTYIKKMKNDPSLGFHLAHLKLTPNKKQLHAGVIAIDYKQIDESTLSAHQKKELKKLYKEHFVSVKKNGINLLRTTSVAKSLAWIPELAQNGKIISRNNIMSPHVSHIYTDSSKDADLLQEYFIPVDNLISFIKSLGTITKQLNVNLMHVALRFIPQNNESFLSYTKTDRIGIVLYFSHKINEKECNTIKQWSQNLIDAAITCNGAYYLPMQLHASKEQIRKIYPEIDEFFELKKKYDPHTLFMNCFYKEYSK